MKEYKDSEGVSVMAYQLSPVDAGGPTLLNVQIGGGLFEICAEAGEWLVHLPDGRVVKFTNDAFVGSFSEV